ncbi:hypothetical protein [Neisseria perflava]|uniref:hypothetical protein n=1 Tax=Neisseria perflava TaxID=33053 RepID=UPI0020A140A2|nr:hypothetical protein [Neisseria perflava]MCP1661272.1 hypothetical protein [Neisseria perflava]MCP1773383.1 hypothetical protein [Neisseria perflava]
MKKAFILSDCEYPDRTQKPFALLTANPTKEHHYIAQTEQRQHAHNPGVSPQNQNIYKLPRSVFEGAASGKNKKHKRNGNIINANIINNLCEHNLYTLTLAVGTPNQYNLESWFNRHESGYEDACQALRTLPAGRINIPEQLWRVLRLKLLGILRNPHNHRHPFARRLHQAIRGQLPEAGFEFVRLISQRDSKRIEHIMQTYRFSFLDYVNWLANLYGMLSEGVQQPSLFEQMFRAGFENPEAVRIELYRYPDTGLCLLNDRGFCLQHAGEQLSLGVNIAHDMFALIHVDLSMWPHVKTHFHNMPTRKQGKVNISDGNHNQRRTFNRLCIRHARFAVYGKSAKPQDYL